MNTVKHITPIELTLDTLKELLHYDRMTGEFTWRRRPHRFFSSNKSHATWNAKFSGKTAGSISKEGYLHIKLLGATYKAHRLAWLYVTGMHPKDCIDHIDHNRANNVFTNLRLASDSVNGKNKSMFARNTSGTTGVSWDRVKGKWYAQICVDGRKIPLGRFTRKCDAQSARMSAESHYGFHANHGK